MFPHLVRASTTMRSSQRDRMLQGVGVFPHLVRASTTAEQRFSVFFKTKIEDKINPNVDYCMPLGIRSPWQSYAARGIKTQPVAKLRSPWLYFAARGKVTQPVACYAARGKVTQPVALCSLRSAHCALLNERVASPTWSPIRSMVPCGPVFRREVRSWLPLFGPLLGPWSPVVLYFVGRFARGFIYLIPY